MCNCKGMMKGIAGILILVNAFVWPRWTGIDGWIAFFGVLMILGAVVKMLVPCEDCCQMPEAPARKRKR